MKIIKSIGLIILIAATAVLSVKVKNNANSKEEPKYMGNVFYKKEVPIQTIDQIKPDQNRFKESDKQLELPAGMESPEIVRTPFPPRYNVPNRVAKTTQQLVTNHQVFDILNIDHQHYYDKDKKAYIMDNHFAEYENFLIGRFSDTIKKGLNPDPKLEHVDDYKGSKAPIKIDNVPKIFPEAVKTSLNYGNIRNNDPKVMKTATDPYSQIFGGRDK